MIGMRGAPLWQVCAAAALDSAGAQLLHDRANACYHLPRVGVVVRMRHTRGSAEWQRRLTAAIQVAAWLAEQDFPTVAPARLDAVEIAGWTATFWRYVAVDESAARAAVADLAAMLRQLHDLPAPPVKLAETNPLGSLQADLDQDTGLADEQRAWLRGQADQIAAAYPGAQHIPLGYGLVHGDAHRGNLLPSADQPGLYLLGDWDSVAYGPRAQDLIPTLIGVRRFGAPYSDWAELCRAYGANPDLEADPGVQLLARAREIRSLAAYIRTIDRPDVRAELDKRLRTLIEGTGETWLTR